MSAPCLKTLIKPLVEQAKAKYFSDFNVCYSLLLTGYAEVCAVNALYSQSQKCHFTHRLYESVP